MTVTELASFRANKTELYIFDLFTPIFSTVIPIVWKLNNYELLKKEIIYKSFKDMFAMLVNFIKLELIILQFYS